jgi:hypothetical protein
MTRIIAAVLAFYIALGWASWAAWGNEPKSWPYECLPIGDANGIHHGRGEEVQGFRDVPSGRLWLWSNADGGFWVVLVEHGSPLACLVLRLDHDPRQSVGT